MANDKHPGCFDIWVYDETRTPHPVEGKDGVIFRTTQAEFTDAEIVNLMRVASGCNLSVMVRLPEAEDQ